MNFRNSIFSGVSTFQIFKRNLNLILLFDSFVSINSFKSKCNATLGFDLSWPRMTRNWPDIDLWSSKFELEFEFEKTNSFVYYLIYILNEFQIARQLVIMRFPGTDGFAKNNLARFEKFLFVLLTNHLKVGCVFPMVIVSLLTCGEIRTKWSSGRRALLYL